MMQDVSGPQLRAHFDRLVRLARRLGHGPEDAEDLAQECLVAFTSGTFDGRSSLETWLYRVLWNKHIDRLRRRPPPTVARPDAWAPSPEAGETRDRVHAALRRLPELPRAVLAFRFFESLPYAEMSKILSRPVGTLKAECFRALEELHDLLDRGSEEKES